MAVIGSVLSSVVLAFSPSNAMKPSHAVSQISAPPAMADTGLARIEEDPFAGETPLSQDELQEARGGYQVAGFIFEFGIQVSNLAVTTAIDAADLASEPDILGMTTTFDIDPSITTLVINNSLDGVRIHHRISLDVVIPNFDRAVNDFIALSNVSAAGVSNSSILGVYD